MEIDYGDLPPEVSDSVGPGGTHNFAFLTYSWVMWMLLVEEHTLSSLEMSQKSRFFKTISYTT